MQMSVNENVIAMLGRLGEEGGFWTDAAYQNHYAFGMPPFDIWVWSFHLPRFLSSPGVYVELPLELIIPLTDLEVEDLTEVVIQCQCSQDDLKPSWKKVIESGINI